MASARSRVAAAMVLNGPPDFLKYLCVVCKFILKDAVQTSCGHWLCQECAEDVFRAAASRLRSSNMRACVQRHHSFVVLSKALGVVTRASYLSVNMHMHKLVCKEVSKLKTELESVYKIEAKDAEISKLKDQISILEKKVQTKESKNEDRGFRLSLLENVNYDGTMIWKIPQFAQRMADAQSGKFFSLPFYTSRYGYKLCLRLYILGDGIGKGTHMSLFFVVMRGEFDNILQWPFTLLQWPFTPKVTFRLLNQGAGQDVVDSFLPDPMSSSFKKPKTDMNVASGCPRFVSISDVKSGGFIADDTIFIKVKFAHFDKDVLHCLEERAALELAQPATKQLYNVVISPDMDCSADLCSKACLFPQLEKGSGSGYTTPDLEPNWSLSHPALFDL
eukprot:Em0011g259a